MKNTRGKRFFKSFLSSLIEFARVTVPRALSKFARLSWVSSGGNEAKNWQESLKAPISCVQFWDRITAHLFSCLARCLSGILNSWGGKSASTIKKLWWFHLVGFCASAKMRTSLVLFFWAPTLLLCHWWSNFQSKKWSFEIEWVLRGRRTNMPSYISVYLCWERRIYFDWFLTAFWLIFDCILTAFWLHFDWF